MPKIKVYTDGSCLGNGTEDSIGGIGVVGYLKGNKVISLQELVPGPITNNEAEYLAISHALSIILDTGLGGDIEVYCDSKLVVNQSTGVWSVKKDHLKPYCQDIKNFLKLGGISLNWIPREKNQEANDLAQQITEVNRNA